MKEAVDQEINRMEEQGILESVPYSEWTSPIVIVPKAAGHYKTTVNPLIENDTFPVPAVDEIFEKMEGGKLFTKIDLTQAYLQRELDEESKKIHGYSYLQRFEETKSIDKWGQTSIGYIPKVYCKLIIECEEYCG